MLNRNEIALIDEKFAVEGKLEGETLVVVLFPNGTKSLLLSFDGGPQGLKASRELARLIDPNCELKIVCAEKERRAAESLAQLAKGARSKIVTYARRCRWRFDHERGSLKVLPEDKIRVMIVDDSKTIRSLLEKIFSTDPDLEIVGNFGDPQEAVREIGKIKPDVMTLDIHMPGLTGLDVLRRIMPQNPVPTIMVSSVGIQDGRDVLNALELGAIDYVQKPSFEEISVLAPILLEKVKVAATIDVRSKRQVAKPAAPAKVPLAGLTYDRRKVIFIGSSTGGTEAIKRIFRSMPKQFPPVVITQHIPKHFSLAFAESLGKQYGITVSEAVDGQEVRANEVLIAPGGLQMEVVADKAGGLRVRVFDGEPVNRHKPSVDVLFRSAAKVVGKHAVGIILTGMGADGAEGLKRMRESGAMTMAQDQATSVVYGMPRVATENGAAQKVLGIDEFAAALLEECRMKSAA